MLRVYYVFFMLMSVGAVMIPLVFGRRRKKKYDTVKAGEDQAQPQKKSLLSAVPYRRLQLDPRGLQKLNRDLCRLHSSVERNAKWMLLWAGAMIVSLVLGVLTHEKMVFYSGMLFAIIGIFSYVLISTVGFHCLLSRTKKHFWGELAPRLLEQTFSDYSAAVTGSKKDRRLTGSFSVENEKFQAQIQFSAAEDFVRRPNQKNDYYNIVNRINMRIVPSSNLVPGLDLELVPNDSSFLGTMIRKSAAVLSNTLSEFSGSNSSREEVVLDDPEFRSRFRVLSSQSAAAEIFLTENRRDVILELSRYLGKMKIRYCDGIIYVTFYGIEVAGYAHMSHTGLPLSFTEGDLESLLHEFEMALCNLPTLWQPLAGSSFSAFE